MTDSPLLRINKMQLADLKRRYKGCTAEDVKRIVKFQIDELEQKIKNIIENEKSGLQKRLEAE